MPFCFLKKRWNKVNYISSNIIKNKNIFHFQYTAACAAKADHRFKYLTKFKDQS